MNITKAPYWDQLVEYYYDEIHWREGFNNIYEWLEFQYGARSSTTDVELRFKDDKKAMWFKLRWNCEG